MTFLLDSLIPQYGKFSLSVSTSPPTSLPAYKDGVRGADPRLCATGHATDAPAGALRFNMTIRADEICDGVHDWHALKELEEPATLLLDGTAMASGKIRGNSDTLDGKYAVLSSYADFNHLEDIKDKFQQTVTLEIVTAGKNFPPILLKKMGLKRVMKELQHCQESVKMKAP